MKGNPQTKHFHSPDNIVVITKNLNKTGPKTLIGFSNVYVSHKLALCTKSYQLNKDDFLKNNLNKM